MTTKTRTGQKSSGTHREWKFKDHSDAPTIVPESWAVEGAREDGDGQRFYAVEVRPGHRYKWTVDHTGARLEGPHTDQPAIQALYVTADGARAIVLESEAHAEGDRVVPHADWPSVITRPASAGDAVDPERRNAYRALIRDLYGEVDD